MANRLGGANMMIGGIILAQLSNCIYLLFSYMYNSSCNKMKYNKNSIGNRKRIFDAFNKDRNWREVAPSLAINLNTLYNIHGSKKKTPNKKGDLHPKKIPA